MTPDILYYPHSYGFGIWAQAGFLSSTVGSSEPAWNPEEPGHPNESQYLDARGT